MIIPDIRKPRSGYSGRRVKRILLERYGIRRSDTPCNDTLRVLDAIGALGYFSTKKDAEEFTAEFMVAYQKKFRKDLRERPKDGNCQVIREQAKTVVQEMRGERTKPIQESLPLGHDHITKTYGVEEIYRAIRALPTSEFMELVKLLRRDFAA